MKSVGEVMAIGRTFKEALMKGVSSLEKGKTLASEKIIPEMLDHFLCTPAPERLAYIHYALSQGITEEEIHEKTFIDLWFLNQLKEIVELEQQLGAHALLSLPEELLRECKRAGFSDQNVAEFLLPDGEAKPTAMQVMELRRKLHMHPVFKRVDTCAAEFESFTPYLYSTYETECEAKPSNRKKIMVLGSGPNRIGQGLEFDYCCCHASFSLKEAGFENDHGQLQSGDRFDRLRYFGPALF